MTPSWSSGAESSSAAAALLAAAGVSVVIRGDISERDGKCVRADAVCRTPFAADDQKAAVDEVAAALRVLRRDRPQEAARSGTSMSRERIGGMAEIAWFLSPKLFVGCAICPSVGSRFVALWRQAGDLASLAAQKDVLRMAVCYEMVLLRRSRAAGNAALTAKIATQTLNRLAIPLFVLGPDREIVRMNSAARAWLRADRRLKLSNRRLIGGSALLNAQLRAAVERSTMGPSPDLAIVPLAEAAGSGPAVTLSCASMPEPRDHVLIAVQERRCDLNLAQQTLTALGLTQAERRLASFLGTGMDLQTAASTSGITFSTARSYLKRIFGKLGIARQSDLVGLVAALTPVFLTEDAARPDRPGATHDLAEGAYSEDFLEKPDEDRPTPSFGRLARNQHLVLAERGIDHSGLEPGPDPAC